MHRDTSTTNLTIGKFDPPHAVIGDLDSLTFEPESSDHRMDTGPYTAPETAVLKRDALRMERNEERRA